jgi:hypothetical protein
MVNQLHYMIEFRGSGERCLAERSWTFICACGAQESAHSREAEVAELIGLIGDMIEERRVMRAELVQHQIEMRNADHSIRGVLNRLYKTIDPKRALEEEEEE